MSTEDTIRENFRRRYIGIGVVVKVMPEHLSDFIGDVKLNGFYINEITVMDNAEYYLIKVFESEKMIGEAYRTSTIVKYKNTKECRIQNCSRVVTNNCLDMSNGVFYSYMGVKNE